jgi:hypothetical protein
MTRITHNSVFAIDQMPVAHAVTGIFVFRNESNQETTKL